VSGGQECFKEGQLVRPRVVSVDAPTKRLTLTLRSKKDGESDEAASSGALGALQPGDLVQGEVERMAVDEQGTIGVTVSERLHPLSAFTNIFLGL
jgi:ribosomal protein S1